MSGIYSPHASIFDSDAYGVDTDNPPCPRELIEDALNVRAEDAMIDGYTDWLVETASEYFDTSDWGEEWWDAWREIVNDLVMYPSLARIKRRMLNG